MNCTVEEAEVFFKHFKLQKKEGVEMLICPPFTDLTLTNFFLARTSVRWGAQNVYPEEKGAFTGEISPAMLKGLGCSYVICGHSERREILGESDEFIARKVKAVKEHGMTPILCVGETAEERKNGQTEERIASEIRSALGGIDKKDVGSLVIAYEPIWAIGSGAAATAEDAEAVCAFIRETVKDIAGKKAASSTVVPSRVKISLISSKKKTSTELSSAAQASNPRISSASMKRLGNKGFIRNHSKYSPPSHGRGGMPEGQGRANQK